MKTILIPTDFNIQSLKPIPALVNKYYPENVNIILVHMMGITDCVRELLMLSRRSAEYQHISQEFYSELGQLKAKYFNQINSTRIEFFYGNTLAVFKNFLEANDVDAILHVDGYSYKMLNKSSINPTVLTARCSKMLVRVDASIQPEPQLIKTIPIADQETELVEQYV